MKEQEKKRAKRTQTIAICSCLCLLAAGAGVGYRAWQQNAAEVQQDTKQPQEQRVTMVQSSTLDTAISERTEQMQAAEKSSETVQPKPAVQQQTPTPAPKAAAEPVFQYPLEGEVVMPYSVDHAIYDPTLEQYRTNESISLSAEAGTAVQAAADGKVQKITADAEMGNTIVIAHENGWLTTYGQLEDTVAVKQGEAVKQGQVIGAVDTPTKYGVALGSHLDFAIEKDGKSVNPQEKLTEH